MIAGEVIAYCQGQIASFKASRHVHFVDGWPVSATKIQKFGLCDQLLEELGSTLPRQAPDHDPERTHA